MYTAAINQSAEKSAPELNALLKQMIVLPPHTPAFLRRLSQIAEPWEFELAHMLALPTSGLLGKSLNDFHLEASWGLQPLVEKFNNCWQGKKSPPETSKSLNFSNCTAEI